MKIINKYFTILIVLFSFITSSYSQDQIVYLDLDKVLNNTKSGSLILSQLEKSKNAALVKFEKKEAELKKIEDEIKKQKNIVSEDELKKKLFEFRKEVSNFRQERQKVVNDFNRKKKLEFEKFFKKITPIIENYVAEKNIDILLDKKNIFVANKKKNITQEIIKIIDSKIK
jgi:Skp family chaperone for outer membrane proteins|tara:strand:- start:405 stop:917 length:513 start_codon:yes stop_codon:yes gene_type:complete